MSRARQYDSRVHKPIRTEFEGIVFDSQWELSVYQNLRYLFPKESIACHVPFPVLPASDFFPRLDWKVDFTVIDNSLRFPVYIEAKGVVNHEIKLLLQALAHTCPQMLNYLLIVNPQSGIKMGRKLTTCNLDLMIAYLSRIKN